MLNHRLRRRCATIIDVLKNIKAQIDVLRMLPQIQNARILGIGVFMPAFWKVMVSRFELLFRWDIGVGSI
ncbi:hypothetical protein O9992_27175 [Vibrio lentus]|nr:hypothetical protein [Vibrio lentus]